MESVESLCNVLARNRVLPGEEVRALRQRWLGEAREQAADVGRFTKWLVANRYLTEYQVGFLERGHADKLILDQYKILDRIGKGRMAGVYLAVHPLGQTVAIKILPPSKAKDATILARFQRESRLALRLKHPNVVRTFQAGEYNGLYYLVMEHLEGETLDEVLGRRGKLPPPEAVRVVYQALLGLQHIHEQGLVHRDLKPANLMLVGGQPNSLLEATVKVLDIGTGRALFDEASPGGNFELTNEGELLGTPDYLAPEAARDAHGADIRADIYSLGCVLYHALAGQPPFPDASRVRQLVRHATEQPRPVRDFNPAVPDGLQQILNWMLAKDPAQRYPTPDRAAKALQVFLTAAAESLPLEMDPRMRPYLQWLAEQTVAYTPEELVEAPARPAPPAPPPPPAAKPKTKPPPPPAQKAPRKGTAAAPPAPPTLAPVEAADGAEEVEPVEVKPIGPPRGRPRHDESVDVDLVPVESSEEEGGGGWTQRELILLGVGIGLFVLLVVGGIVTWLVLRSPG